MYQDHNDKLDPGAWKFKRFDVIEFRNGYGKKVPAFRCGHIGTKIGQGRHEWGAPGLDTFIIKLAL